MTADKHSFSVALDNGITIRSAVRDDAATIDALLRQLAKDIGEPGDYQNSMDALASHGFGEQPHFSALLASDHARTIGLCLYFPEYSTWRGEAGVYVQDLFVDASVRGTGLGRSLVDHALAHASRLWAARYIRLAVHRHNEAARQFYQKMGFDTDQDNAIMIRKAHTPPPAP